MNDREEISEEIKLTVDRRADEAIEQGRVRRQRGAYFWLVAAAYMVAAPALAILVSRQISIDAANRAVSESEMRLCAIVVLSDDYYQSTPPASDTLKRQAAAMRQLRAEYHCPPTIGAKK